MVARVTLCRDWRAGYSLPIHQTDEQEERLNFGEVCLFTRVLGLYPSSAHHWFSWLNAPAGFQYVLYHLRMIDSVRYLMYRISRDSCS